MNAKDQNVDDSMFKRCMYVIRIIRSNNYNLWNLWSKKIFEFEADKAVRTFKKDSGGDKTVLADKFDNW